MTQKIKPMTRFDPLKQRFPDQFKAEESMARHTVARLGGNAEGVLYVKRRDDMLWAVRWATSHQIPWLILGGGANVLPSDAGYRGLLIINQMRETALHHHTGLVEAESGAALAVLARHCMAQGLAGLEWSVSVPGTVGGAVVNNAGAHGDDMAHHLLDCQVYDAEGDTLSIWTNADLHYAYRYSSLKGLHGRHIVLSARLQLEAGHDPAELQAQAETFIQHRKHTQPPGASLGSMFKNPTDDYAGRLIEAAGLKGKQIGGVQISPIHANFFINLGNGTAADYHALIELARQTVLEKFGIELELEIECVGDW
jgi:UDP-N-acetylmuramate dehydrogenase